METVVEINEKGDTGESGKNDISDTPPQGRLPPLQPMKVTPQLLLSPASVFHCLKKELDFALLTTVKRELF